MLSRWQTYRLQSLNSLRHRFTKVDVWKRLTSSQTQPVQEKENVWDQNARILFLTELIRGLRVTLENFFKKPYTIYYPFEKGPLSVNMR
jgi:hypothetical protein